VPIIRRNNCVYVTLGTCYSVWMTVWYAGAYAPAYQTRISVYVVHLSISTCFGRLCAHHQEKQLCLCETCYLLFCVDYCPVCRSIYSCIPDSNPHRITSSKCHINTVVSPDDGYIDARNMQRLISILRIDILRIDML